jgi:poly(beta-D-mannuronate) lyase
VTEVVIDHFNNPERYETDYWVMLYGKHNRFDHNHLVGKSNQGVTMAVKLDSEESRANRHRIDHNYFGPRPVLGSNGGETLRIGTSHYSLSDSLTVVQIRGEHIPRQPFLRVARYVDVAPRQRQSRREQRLPW